MQERVKAKNMNQIERINRLKSFHLSCNYQSVGRLRRTVIQLATGTNSYFRKGEYGDTKFSYNSCTKGF